MTTGLDSSVPARESDVDVAALDVRSKVLARLYGMQLQHLAREPLLHFVVLGILVWTAVEHWNGDQGRYSIVIGPAERQRIADSYRMQYGQSPTSDELLGLVDRYIHDEIFLREGRALHLDRNDEIVRRRIIQKYEFLQTDLATPVAPDARALAYWYAKHRERYRGPERFTISHVYFSIDHGGSAMAKARATRALLRLRRDESVSGDAFPGPVSTSPLSLEETVRVFGQSELTQQLWKLQVGHWEGPLRSGYGWHLVLVAKRAPGTLPTLDEVRERASADYLDEQRRKLNRLSFDELRKRYAIVREGGP